MATRHKSLDWINNFLQDFPFQGDVADRLREGSRDILNKKKMDAPEVEETNNKPGVGAVRRVSVLKPASSDLCSFSCHPIKSLTRGLKILSLLHDLVRTVK